MPETNDTPLCTFTVTSDTTGPCYIPDTFHEHLSIGLASLDFARVWAARGSAGAEMTSVELKTAANHFEALARQCRTFAGKATA